MGALTDEVGQFLGANVVGGLATLVTDGKPRQPLVYFAREGAPPKCEGSETPGFDDRERDEHRR